MKKTYTEQSVLEHLSRHGIRPEVQKGRFGNRNLKQIEVTRGTVGNGLLGKLDYLASVHGYHIYFI